MEAIKATVGLKLLIKACRRPGTKQSIFRVALVADKRAIALDSHGADDIVGLYRTLENPVWQDFRYPWYIRHTHESGYPIVFSGVLDSPGAGMTEDESPDLKISDCPDEKAWLPRLLGVGQTTCACLPEVLVQMCLGYIFSKNKSTLLTSSPP